MTPVDAVFAIRIGGRFPSDLQVPRNRNVSVGESSGSSEPEREATGTAISGALPVTSQIEYAGNGQDPYRLDGVSAGTRPGTAYSGVQGSYFEQTPAPEQQRGIVAEPQQESFLVEQPADRPDPSADHSSLHGEWMAPAAAGIVGAGAGVAAVAAYEHQNQNEATPQTSEDKPEVPEKSKRRSYTPSENNSLAFATNESATNVQMVAPVPLAQIHPQPQPLRP